MNELEKVLMHYNVLFDCERAKQAVLCPFHNDTRASMMIDLNKKTWYCFVCGIGGDAKKFVRYAEKEDDDLKALQKYYKILKSDGGSVTIEKGDYHRHKENEVKYKKEMYLNAWNYYHCLNSIDWENVKGGDALDAKKYMNERGFSDATLNEVKAKYTFDRIYPIIFPIYDNKKFKGWVMRTTDKRTESRRKYLFNKGFQKASTIVGNYSSDNGFIIVTEGYIDQMKFIENGIENAVSILGWKMSDRQIEKLKRVNVKNIICALDNDECGKRGYAYLKKFFKVKRFKYLNGYKDPAEMSNEQFMSAYNETLNI